MTASPTACEDVAEFTIVAIEDYLNVLNSYDDEAGAVWLTYATATAWIDAYLLDHSDDARVEAFLVRDVDPALLSQLADEVASYEGVRVVQERTAEENLAMARELFADDPAMLEVLESKPETIGPSLDMLVDKLANQAVIDRLATLDEIRDVVAEPEALPTIVRLVEGVGLPVPGLADPTRRAVELGCDPEEFIDLVKSKAAGLEATSAAAEAFISPLTE